MLVLLDGYDQIGDDVDNAHQYINQTSGRQEWRTPNFILDAARDTLGHFDLDVASNIRAQNHVKADLYYDIKVDGLQQQWYGRVWMNHPFGRKENPLWTGKLIEEYEAGHIHSALCITYASTSERWFQALMRYPQCYLAPRTNYIDMNTGEPVKGVPKGSCVTYFGDWPQMFCHRFNELGTIMWPGTHVPMWFRMVNRKRMGLMKEWEDK